jgi:hypothetical protein
VVVPPATRPIVAEPPTTTLPPEIVPLDKLPAVTDPPEMLAVRPFVTDTEPDPIPPVIRAWLANDVAPVPVSDASVVVPEAAVNRMPRPAAAAFVTAASDSPVPLIVADPPAATESVAEGL